MTTIAVNLQNQNEFQSYFEQGKRAVTTIFGVDFIKEAKSALAEQRDFITGNFYAIDAQSYFSGELGIKKHRFFENLYSTNRHGHFAEDKNKERKTIAPETSPKKGWDK